MNLKIRREDLQVVPITDGMQIIIWKKRRNWIVVLKLFNWKLSVAAHINCVFLFQFGPQLRQNYDDMLRKFAKLTRYRDQTSDAQVRFRFGINTNWCFAFEIKVWLQLCPGNCKQLQYFNVTQLGATCVWPPYCDILGWPNARSMLRPTMLQYVVFNWDINPGHNPPYIKYCWISIWILAEAFERIPIISPQLHPEYKLPPPPPQTKKKQNHGPVARMSINKDVRWCLEFLKVSRCCQWPVPRVCQIVIYAPIPVDEHHFFGTEIPSQLANGIHFSSAFFVSFSGGGCHFS